MPKKPLYTGDPNATLTICPKKARRHLPKDLLYLSLPVEIDPNESGEVPDTKPEPKILVVCKHCDSVPFIHKEENEAI